MIAAVIPDRAQCRQVGLAQVDEPLQDPPVDVRIRHGDICWLQCLDHRQRLDGLLGLGVLLGIG